MSVSVTVLSVPSPMVNGAAERKTNAVITDNLNGLLSMPGSMEQQRERERKNTVITDNLNGMNGFIIHSESPICEAQENFDH